MAALRQPKLQLLPAKSSSFTGRQLKSKASSRVASRPAPSVTITAGVVLEPKPLNTAQKLACMTYSAGTGYSMYEALPIEFPKNTIVVGSDTRPGTEIDVIVAVPSVAGKHASLEVKGDSVVVTDFSGTGTYVDNKKIEGSVTAEAGAEISFDMKRGVTYVVGINDSPAPAPEEVPAIDGKMFNASLEDRLQDRSAWISKWRGSGSALEAPVEGGMAYDAPLDDRIADRSAWIAKWRDSPGSEDGPTVTAVGFDADAWIEKYKLSPEDNGMAYDAPLEARIADRSAWISKWRGSGSAAEAPLEGGMAYDAPLTDRIADRTSWISKWRAASQSAPSGMAYDASLEDRVADRSLWIETWRSSSSNGVAYDAPIEARVEDRKAWIDGYKSRSKATA